MSIERQARRALWRMVFWRFVGELFYPLQIICRAAQALVTGIGTWFRRLEMAVFCMECDAARKYKLLTGLDMGTATGEPGRYSMLDPARNDQAQEMFLAQHGIEDEEEDS